MRIDKDFVLSKIKQSIIEAQDEIEDMFGFIPYITFQEPTKDDIKYGVEFNRKKRIRCLTNSLQDDFTIWKEYIEELKELTKEN